MSGDRKTVSWRELLEKTVDLGLGAALLTKEAATKLVDDVVKKGSMSKEDGQKLVSEMLEKGKEQKGRMEAFVRQTIERMLTQADLARQSAVDDLAQRVAELEEEVRQHRREEDTPSASDSL